MSINNSAYKKQALDIALAYAGRGWRVSPVHSFIDGICTCDDPKCDDPAKHPINHDGCTGASTDPELINAWHSETDGLCNWGIATGEGSGLWVLDVDPRHGGDKTLAELEAQHGLLPLTLTVSTGGGGKHYFFRWAEGVKNRTAILPGLDVRGEGGYVVAPPSLHKSGKRYELLTPSETPLADPPAWLLALVRGEAEKPVAANSMTFTVKPGAGDFTSPGVGEGERNAACARYAGVHVARGETLEQIEAQARAWAAKCTPPLSEAKAVDHVRRLYHKHHAKAGAPSPVNAPSVAPADAEPWPVLHPDALYGLAGEIVKAISPETEADPVGVLLALLVAVGNIVGRQAYFMAGARRHHPNLFVALVGEPSTGKGEAWALAEYLIGKADPGWKEKCVAGGFGSGEGLVWRVRDPQEMTKPVKVKGQVTGFTTELDDRITSPPPVSGQAYRGVA
jgi:hypothetical protein